MSITKLYAPIFDIPANILEEGRFDIKFVPISVNETSSTRTEIEGADMPSGTLLRISDYNITVSDEIDNEGEDVFEIIGISYTFLNGVHIVGCHENDKKEDYDYTKFYLYDEKRAGTSIAELVGDDKAKPLVDGYKIDSNGNIVSEADQNDDDEDNPSETNIEEIINDKNDDEDDNDEPEEDFHSIASQLVNHFNGNDVKEDIEESKKVDKPHKNFIGNPNEQTKKEIQRPIVPSNIKPNTNFNNNHNEKNKRFNNNQKNFNQNNNRDESRKMNYSPNNIDFGSIVNNAFPRN